MAKRVVDRHDLLTIDKMSTADLVAVIIDKQETDDECHLLASHASSEYDLNLLRESSTKAYSRRVGKVIAAIELGRRQVMRKAVMNSGELNSPENVYKLMKPFYSGTDREIFYTLCLNTKNELIKMVQVSIGILDAAQAHPREMFKEAVKLSAASVIIVHNHPSGKPEPSRADIKVNERMIQAGEVLGIPLLDHVIIGNNGGGYVSLREEGEFNKGYKF